MLYASMELLKNFKNYSVTVLLKYFLPRTCVEYNNVKDQLFPSRYYKVLMLENTENMWRTLLLM